MQNGFKVIKSDYLVIGSGLAGLYAANHAAQFGTVSIITKSKLKLSSSYLAQGGIAAAIHPQDSTEQHFYDTIKAGKNFCNSDAVKILVNEGKTLVEEMIKNGAPFDLDDGKPVLGMEGGHSQRRILHAGGDITGSVLVNYFVDIVQSKSNIQIFEDTVVYKLMSNGKACFGALAYHWPTEDCFQFSSGVTILATGGASGIYSRTTNPHTSTGDGIGLAYEAGACLADMEFIQFHPTSFYSNRGETFLISEAVRGEGAYITNHQNERFVLKEHPAGELITRDLLSRSIFNELNRSGKKNVFLRMDHLDHNKVRNRFSNIYKMAIQQQIDITKDPVPVAPAAHYMIGGVVTDLDARTTLSGLFACGEVASTGVHGANRLASNSLLECIVFAKRAVDYAMSHHSDFLINDLPDEKDKYYIDDKNELFYCDIKNELAGIMMASVGIERNAESLNNAIMEIKRICNKFDVNEYEYYTSRLSSIILVCKLITESALMRKESRGVHYRTDFTDGDENFFGNIVHQKNLNPELVKSERETKSKPII